MDNLQKTTQELQHFVVHDIDDFPYLEGTDDATAEEMDAINKLNHWMDWHYHQAELARPFHALLVKWWQLKRLISGCRS